MIYFTADTHFWHKKILIHQFDTRQQFLTPEDRAVALELIRTNRVREFAPSIPSIEAMNRQLLDNINAKVGEDDTLWILGDFCLSDGSRMRKIFDSIRCKDIRITLGNHDWQPDLKRYCNFREIHQSTVVFEFPREPGILRTQDEVFDCKDLYKELEHNYKKVKKVYLSHYCSLTYPLKSASFHLYGHSHGALPVAYECIPSMDVGVDAIGYYQNPRTLKPWFDPLAPISWEQVKELMADRISRQSDANYFDLLSASNQLLKDTHK